MHINLNCKVGRIIPPPSTPSSANGSTAKYRSPSYFCRLARRKAFRDLNVSTDEYFQPPLTEKVLDETTCSANDPEVTVTADVCKDNLDLHHIDDSIFQLGSV